jgi:iron complex outermembrane receptor protein
MSHINARPIRLTPLALALALSHTSAWAADSGPVEEIIVLGQGIGSLRLQSPNAAGSRLGLTAFETPASVDLVTRSEILTKGDYNSIDSITRTAGISSTANNGNGGTQISSRGFDGHGTTITMYDGIRLYIAAGTVTFPADSWTLDRIEVLRGAGSVINGMGALATTINYVPRKAVIGENSFDALGAIGSFGMTRAAAGGNIAINDQLAARLDAAVTDKNGFVDRGDDERKVAAGSLLWQPNADFSMRFSLDYADLRPSTYFGTPLVNGEASHDLRQQNYNFADAVVHYRDVWGRVHTEWNLSDNVTFRNDTFYIKDKREWQNLEEYYYAGNGTVDRMSYLGIAHDQSQVGTRADFLVTGKLGDMDNRFTVGAEINKSDLDYNDNFNSGGFDVSYNTPLFGGQLLTRPSSVFMQPDYSTTGKQHAFFFDDVLNVTDRLSLVLGGRFDKFDFDRVTFAQVTGRDRSTFESSFDKFTWRAGVVFNVTDTFNVYAQTSTAADPISSPLSINAADANFKLSTGRQVEVGLKQQFMNGNGEWTLAYFDIVKHDLVTRIPGTTQNAQIGQQSSNGVEVTLRLNPIERLSLDMNAAFINAEFDKYFAGDVSLAGNTPSNVPDVTANLWANYSLREDLHLGAGLRYVDTRYTDDTNTATLPSYTVMDAALSWIVNDKATVILRGRNLTDEKNYVLSQYVDNQWVFAEPRAYELSLRYTF